MCIVEIGLALLQWYSRRKLWLVITVSQTSNLIQMTEMIENNQSLSKFNSLISVLTGDKQKARAKNANAVSNRNRIKVFDSHLSDQVSLDSKRDFEQIPVFGLNHEEEE